MITLRLDSELDQLVINTAKNLGLSKSELVRKSLFSYIGNLNKANAWETGQELFGRYASGQGDLSSNRKTILREKLQRKKNEKNSD